MELIWFLRELLKRWRVLVFTLLIAVGATYLLTMQTPKVYKTTARMAAGIADESKASLEDTKELTSSYLIQTKFSNLIELIESRTVFNLVSYSLLHHDLTDPNPFRLTPRQLLEIPEQTKTETVALLKTFLESSASMLENDPRQEHVRHWIEELKYTQKDLQKVTRIDRVETSDFITVDAEAESPELAAFIANTICEQFLRYYGELRKGKNASTIDFFERLVRDKKAELDAKVNELKKYKMDHEIINLYEQTKSLVNQISSLEIIREEENKRIPSLRRAISDIEERFTSKEKSFIEAGLGPSHGRIAQLKQQVQDLNLRLIASGYTDQKIRDSLGRTKDELYEIVKSTSDKLLVDPNVPKQELVLKKLNNELELSMAVQSVESIDKELKRLKKIVEAYAPCEAMISSYEREINVIAEAYLTILNRLTYARLEAQSTGSAQITQRAATPQSAEPSKRFLLIAVAGAGSVVLGIVAIVLVLYLDLTIKTPRQFVQRSDLELLGTINKVSAEKLDLRELFLGEPKQYDELMFQNLLRTFRQHFLEKAPARGIILFTGNHRREGKTTLLICLAFSLKLIGKKILLVDTNFRSPDLTRIFGAKPLLEAVAAGEVSVKEGISHSSLREIDVLGCRGVNTTPSEVGGRFSLAELLATLKTSYDYVFIEGPSLLRYSDSKELAQMADAAVLVFQANTTVQEDDTSAFLYAQSLGVKFLGAVLNKVLPENLEGLYGEVEKKRSGLRRFVKTLVKRNFTRFTNGNMNVSAD